MEGDSTHTGPSDGEDNDTQPVPEENPQKRGYGKKSDFFGGRNSSKHSHARVDEKGGSSYEDKENDSVYDSPGGHVHTHRHKKFRRHHLDEGERSSESLKPASSDGEEDVEDGEILEDGEIDDEEEVADNNDGYAEEEEVHRGSPEKSTSPKKSSTSRSHDSTRSSPGSSHRESRHSHRHDRQEDNVPELQEGNGGEEDRNERSHKERRKKKRSKKDRHEKKDRDRKRKKHSRDYKDPDRPDDQDSMAFNKRSRSPPDRYDSSVFDNKSYDSPNHSRSPSKRRNSPGQCDYGYDSPPGLYDSPSYDEDTDEESTNLMRSLSGSGYDVEYMDSDAQQGHSRKRKADPRGRSRRTSDDNQVPQGPPRKKPLLEIPRHERPHCRFYMEGKCAKGMSCPFNHDFRPPKKLEVCKFYLQSSCSKGGNCIYMHDEYPCKYFHTGADCYQGDNCKFSHEPLTDETRPLLEKILHTEENEKPRPALLGSPPRHLLEDPMKKIPSLFDIQVFPPGQNQSPRKPAPASPSVRPSGFYQDPGSSPQTGGQGPASGPGPGMGPGPGPGMGPRPGPGPGQSPVNFPPPGQLNPVPPVLNMIGAILRGAAPEIVARVAGSGLNQGGMGMPNHRMQGPGMGPGMPQGMGPGPRFMGQGSERPPDIRGPGPNFQNMDQGPAGGRGPQMNNCGPRNQGPFDFRGPPMMDMRDPRAQGFNPQGMDNRGPGMDNRGPGMDNRGQGMDNRGPGMDNRGPPPGMDNRGPPPGMDNRGPPPGMDNRGPPPGMDNRGPPPGMDNRGPPGMDNRGPPPGMNSMGPPGVNSRGPDQRGLEQVRMPMDSQGVFGMDNRQKDNSDPRAQNANDPRDPRNRPPNLRDPRTQVSEEIKNTMSGTWEPRGLLPKPEEGQVGDWNSKGSLMGTESESTVSSDLGKNSSNEGSSLNQSDAHTNNGVKTFRSNSDSNHSTDVRDSKRSTDPRLANMGSRNSPGHPNESSLSPPREADNQGSSPPSGCEDIKESDTAKPANKDSESEMETKQTEDVEKDIVTEENSSDQLDDGKQLDDVEIPSHLPPTQRSLFMRIRQQQQQQDQIISGTGETTDTSEDQTAAAKGTNDAEDDDWYSSDEDTGNAPKLMDILKNINKQPVAQPQSSPQPGSASTASAFNIMQMIQSIKNQSPNTEKTNLATKSSNTTPGSRTAKRQTSTENSKGAVPHQNVIRDYSAMPDGSSNSYNMNVAYPVMEAVLTSMAYRIKTFSLIGEKPYTSVPQTVDPYDESFKTDPRIQKYIARLAKMKPSLSSQESEKKEPTLSRSSSDPRRARHLSTEEKVPVAKPQDPRLKRSDPRIQSNPDMARVQTSLSNLEKVMTQEIAKVLDGRGSDPRLSRVQSNPPPVTQAIRSVTDPRLGRMQDIGASQGPQDPRKNISRQQSLEGLSVRPNGPRPALNPFQSDPRMGPDARPPFDMRMGPGSGPAGFGSRPPFDNRMPFNQRFPFGPRGGMPSRMPFDLRMGLPDQRPSFDPRMGPDQRLHNEQHLMADNRSLVDPRSNDPRVPQGQDIDPRSSSDPRGPGGPSGPGFPNNVRPGPGLLDTPTIGLPGDPRSGSGHRGDPRAGPCLVGDPRAAQFSDARTFQRNDPRSGSGDNPRLQELQRTNSDPRGSRLSIDDSVSENSRDSNIVYGNENTSESESGLSDSQTQQPVKKFDYRNDPRFKRKPASDASEKGILVKKFTGQRKSSMEYSSPLGIDEKKSEDSSGYNSYNRPNPNPKATNVSGNWTRSANNPTSSPVGSLDSPNPPVEDNSVVATGMTDTQPVSLPNEPPLKDLFKSIDPTASPFC